MLRQTFTSQPFLYRLPADIPITAFPSASYHPELVTPPRIYGEEFDGDIGTLFLNSEPNVDGYEVIYLYVTQNMVRWPSYNFTLYRWNSSTGEYLGRVDSDLSSGFLKVFDQSRDGTLWGLDTGTNHLFIYSIDPTTHGLTTDAVVQFDLSGFDGMSVFTAFDVEVAENLLLAGINETNFLVVYNLATGHVLRKVALPGFPVVVMPADLGLCYVQTSIGLIALVDYNAGVVQAVFRTQSLGTGSVFSSYRSITWDRLYRRFLEWNYTPVDTTGQNTSVVSGFFPVPQPTGITDPIPTKPPRKYRTTPILTRCYGDAGEPIPGQLVTLSPGSGIATVAGFPAVADADGDALGNIVDVDAGSLTLTASTTV